jgi:hypothetical protein
MEMDLSVSIVFLAPADNRAELWINGFCAHNEGLFGNPSKLMTAACVTFWEFCPWM